METEEKVQRVFFRPQEIDSPKKLNETKNKACKRKMLVSDVNPVKHFDWKFLTDVLLTVNRFEIAWSNSKANVLCFDHCGCVQTSHTTDEELGFLIKPDH